jgi:hypothetical protein
MKFKEMFARHRLKLFRFGASFIVICFIFHYLGLTAHLFEQSFENFSYPFEGDIFDQCFLIRHNFPPEVAPINNQTFSIRHNNEKKCVGDIFLTIVVKSSINHFVRREAIRSSWGVDGVLDGYQIRTVFTLGVDKSTYRGRGSPEQKLVDLEAEANEDIVQVGRCKMTQSRSFKVISKVSSQSYWIV